LLPQTPDAVQGYFKEHLITAGITSQLYEGDTICYPTNLGNLKSIAESNDKHPAILCSDVSNEGYGRVVVDTGFTKLWLKWDSAGTPRYISNATVWLLGLEWRLNHEKPLQGPININPVLSNAVTPYKEPEETNAGKVDVMLVLDGSGSVGSKNFEKMRDFCYWVKNYNDQ
jgi:hypothetical protein